MLGAPLSVLTKKEPEEETANTGVTLPMSLKKRLEEVAEEFGYSRNEVIVKFLQWALRQHETEQAEEMKKTGKRGH